MKPITKPELRAVNTLWSLYAKHSLDVVIPCTVPGAPCLRSSADVGRTQRLRWAGETLHRRIDSFHELSSADAGTLITWLRNALGQKVENRRRPATREQARTAGMAGKRRAATLGHGPSDADSLSRIDEAITRLGWDRERFDRWLRSSSSPLGKRSDYAIYTQADANRVWWAMKQLLKRAGKWHEHESHDSHASHAPTAAGSDNVVTAQA
jgi:hypothetical protein